MGNELHDGASKLLPYFASPIVEISVTRKVPRWQFPKDRFIEYESSDEAQCRRLGIGREVETEITTKAKGFIGQIERKPATNDRGLAIAFEDTITFRLVHDWPPRELNTTI